MPGLRKLLNLNEYVVHHEDARRANGLGPRADRTDLQDTIWSLLAGGENRRVVLDGGGHQSFTDYADQLEDVTLDREPGFAIVRAYVLAFARRWQLGDTSVDPVLNGEIVIDPAAELLQ